MSAASKAAAAVSEVLPTVVETAELGMEVPTKVVLNQTLVVVTSVAGGVALAVAGRFAVDKIRKHRALRKLKAELQD